MLWYWTSFLILKEIIMSIEEISGIKIKLLSLCSVGEYALQKTTEYFALSSAVATRKKITDPNVALAEVLKNEVNLFNRLSRWTDIKIKIFDQNNNVLSSVNINTLDISALKIVLNTNQFCLSTNKQFPRCCQTCNHDCVQCGNNPCNNSSGKCCVQTANTHCDHKCITCSISYLGCQLKEKIGVIYELRNTSMHLTNKECLDIEKGDILRLQTITRVKNYTWNDVWIGFSSTVLDVICILNKYELQSLDKVVTDSELQIVKDKIKFIMHEEKDIVLKCCSVSIWCILNGDSELKKSNDEILRFVEKLLELVEESSNKFSINIILNGRFNFSFRQYFSYLRSNRKVTNLNDLYCTETECFLKYFQRKALEILDVTMNTQKDIVIDIFKIKATRSSFKIFLKIDSDVGEIPSEYRGKYSPQSKQLVQDLKLSLKTTFLEKLTLRTSVKCSMYKIGSLHINFIIQLKKEKKCSNVDYIFKIPGIVNYWAEHTAIDVIKRSAKHLKLQTFTSMDKLAVIKLGVSFSIHDNNVLKSFQSNLPRVAEMLQMMDISELLAAMKEFEVTGSLLSKVVSIHEESTENSATRSSHEEKSQEISALERLRNEGFDYIRELILNEDIETLTTLLETDRSLIFMRNVNNYTPLHEATWYGSRLVTNLLLNYGADAGAVTVGGLTAYHVAAYWGHADVLDTLVKHDGTKINILDDDKCTPLWYSSSHGHVECVEILLTHNANIDVESHFGITEYEVAGNSFDAPWKSRNIIRILISELRSINI